MNVLPELGIEEAEGCTSVSGQGKNSKGYL